ncbi:MAG: hypothetical protein IKO59_01075 [Bacteroidales bacterium]|nr:hypothetical protein [Bacteroidales bacterium]
MKRLFFFMVLAGCIAVSNAQTAKEMYEAQNRKIQNTFFGNQFGDSFFKVKSKLYSEFGEYNVFTSEKRKEINLYNSTFGGSEWHFITFSFDNTRKFYMIHFSQEYGRKEDAKNRYTVLKELLEVKYGNGADLTTNSLYSTKCWCDNTCCAVLSLTYGQSNGGDYYWYCTLDYYDDKAFTSETKSIIEEL